MSGIEWWEVVSGIDKIWDNKFAEARALFSAKAANSPRYALHLAETVFISSFITADVNDTNAAHALLESCKTLTQSHLKYYEKGQVPPGVTGVEVTDRKAVVNRYLDARLVLGDVGLMLAVSKFARDSKIGAVLQLRKSWKVFEETVEKFTQTNQYDPELVQCMQFGEGFFLFAMSIIPSQFLRLAELVGFKANRSQGLELLRKVEAAGKVRGTFATIVLLFNNLILPRGLADVKKYIEEAHQIISRAVVKYPNGTLLQMMASHCSRKRQELDEGLHFAKLAVDNYTSLVGTPPQMFVYELATVYTMKLDFASAVPIFEKLIAEPTFQIRAISALQLIGCYVMLGQNDKAQDLMKKMPTIAKKSSAGGFDQQALKLTQRYITNGGHFAAFEILYARRDLAKMKKVMAQALQLLDQQASHAGLTNLAITPITPIITPSASPNPPPPTTTTTSTTTTSTSNPQSSTTSTPSKNKFLSGLKSFKSSVSNAIDSVGKKEDKPTDILAESRASYLLLRGAMLKYHNGLDYQESVDCFKQVIALLPHLSDASKWLVPYAWFELCESYFFQGDVKQAAASLKKCSTVKDFVWEDPLKMRMRVTADQLKHGAGADETLLHAAGTAGNNAVVIAQDENLEGEDQVQSAVTSTESTPSTTPAPTTAATINTPPPTTTTEQK